VRFERADVELFVNPLNLIIFPGDLQEKYVLLGAGLYTRPSGDSEEWINEDLIGDATQHLSYELIDAEAGYRVDLPNFYKPYAATITIPSIHNELPVTSIRLEGFANCINLTSIVIPNSVQHIPSRAFRNCTSLTDIVIPNSVVNIPNRALGNCTSLTSVEMSSVVNIQSRAFWNCTSLTSIIIPNSVERIYAGAFADCTSLTEVTFEGVISAGNFSGGDTFPGDLRDKYLQHGIGTYTRDDGEDMTWDFEGDVAEEDIIELPSITSLLGNFPNPFNPETTIRFSVGNGFIRSDHYIPSSGGDKGEGQMGRDVRIEIYNIKGQLVKRLVNGSYSTGSHQVVWTGTDDYGRPVGSGTYFYRMRAGEYVGVKRMMLLK
jgi:hypothetical protein